MNADDIARRRAARGNADPLNRLRARQADKPSIVAKAEPRYATVVFLQGDEADEPLDILTDDDGWLTDETAQAAFEYLLQWENADELETNDSPPWGGSDRTIEFDGYVLSFNRGLHYIALTRIEV